MADDASGAVIQSDPNWPSNCPKWGRPMRYVETIEAKTVPPDGRSRPRGIV